MYLFLPFFQTYSVCHIVIYWHWSGMSLLFDYASQSWCLIHRSSFHTFNTNKVFVLCSFIIIYFYFRCTVNDPSSLPKKCTYARVCTCVRVHVCVTVKAVLQRPLDPLKFLIDSLYNRWFTQNFPLTSTNALHLMRSLPWFHRKDPQLNTNSCQWCRKLLWLLSQSLLGWCHLILA